MAMQRARARWVPLILLALIFVLPGCGRLQEEEKPQIDLTEFLPPDVRTTGPALRLDVDADQKDEWLIFYHVDPVTGEAPGSPIIAAVYRALSDRDSRMPASIQTTLLWVPGQGYLCLHSCSAQMLDVISASPGAELVVFDQAGGGTVGVAIFRWQSDLDVKNLDVGQTEDLSCRECVAAENFSATAVCGGFVPLGHFRDDVINVTIDQVVTLTRRNDRSDLAVKRTYTPQTSGRYYQAEVKNVYDAPRKQPIAAQEIVFASGAPENPTDVKVPEKLVLSFYLNYTNTAEVQRYFTADAWNRIGANCSNGICGCVSARENVARVKVLDVSFSELEPDLVVTSVQCVSNNGGLDPVRQVAWRLERRADNTWRLSDAELW
jgi:hypothetical protein